MRDNPRDVVAVVVGVDILVVGKSRGNDRRGKGLFLSDTEAFRRAENGLQISPAAFRRREKLLQVRRIDDTRDGLALVLEGYRDGKQRKSLAVIGRAVERIDDPAVVARSVAPGAAFLAQDGVIGVARRNGLRDILLALLVCARNHVVDIGFGPDRQVVAPEVGELYPACTLCHLHGKFQELVVHIIHFQQNTCKKAGSSLRPCRTVRGRSSRSASGLHLPPVRSRSGET